jgi:hydroxymethylglutaryl-CoA reductase
MKFLFFSLLLLILAACNQPKDNIKQLQVQIDSLQKTLDNSYTPGFGEFMSSIQMHHAKLWFAGANNNWKLADFQVHKIQGYLQAIQQFNTDRPEAKAINMLNPAIDSVSNAIKQQNQPLFKSSFILLTNTCNNCHRATQYEFNVITIPANPPISNQIFKPVE